MNKLSNILIGMFILLGSYVPSLACTTVIVSGKVRVDGRAVMMKNRDTGHKTNDIKWFQGEKYDFIGLVNTDGEPSKEVWAGTNSAGFCIMNTATYDLKEDEIPQEKMDREGYLMFRALEVCATVEDFDHFLDTLSKPMYVEANFGVTDARGGAVYYEMRNRVVIGLLQILHGADARRIGKESNAMSVPAACLLKPVFPSPNGTMIS